MEASQNICKEHNEPLNVICTGCKSLLCCQCLDTHDFSSHNGKTVSIKKYAKDNIVPAYKNILDDLEKRKDGINKSANELTNSLPKIITGLGKLKLELESFVQSLSKSIDDLKGFAENPKNTYEEVTKAITAEILRIDKAITDGNTKIIKEAMEAIDKRNPILLAGDSEVQLIDGITKAMFKLTQNEEFKGLQQSVNDLVGICKTVLKGFSGYKNEVKSKYVYFVTDPVKSCAKLCRFDTVSRKIIALVKVPQHCSICQVENRIFIAGGNYSNSFLEFDENSQSLITRSSMKYNNNYCGLCAIDSNKLIAVGGCNSNGPCYANCEEYTISNNEWKTLPSLNNGRRGSGLIVVNNNILYAVGGEADNIEKLDLQKKTAWEIVQFSIKEINLSSYPKLIMISNNEALRRLI